VHTWVLRLGGGQARLQSEPVASPSLVLRCRLSHFVRMLTGEIPAGAAALDGRLKMEGDYQAMIALLRMLGG